MIGLRYALTYRNLSRSALTEPAIVARAGASDIIRHVNGKRPRWWQNWLERHQNRASRALHAVGIPLVVGALLLAAAQLWSWRWDLWWRPAVLFIVGYVLQYLGHRMEGNDMGEVVLVKKLLGRPYVAVAPRRSAARAGAGNVASHDDRGFGNAGHGTRWD